MSARSRSLREDLAPPRSDASPASNTLLVENRSRSCVARWPGMNPARAAPPVKKKRLVHELFMALHAAQRSRNSTSFAMESRPSCVSKSPSPRRRVLLRMGLGVFPRFATSGVDTKIAVTSWG
jgi:hypothetical protein